MTKLPRVNGKEVIRALRKLGFSILRIKGSHHFLTHPDGRCTVVPIHGNEIIGLGLLHKILRDIEIDAKEFRNLL